MVMIGFVIEKDEKALNYIHRFIEVFSKVRASPFHNTKLFDTFNTKIKLFDDRIIFLCYGKISAFSTIKYLLWCSLVLLVFIIVFLDYNNFVPVVQLILYGVLFVGITTQAIGYFSYSKWGFWISHRLLINFKKKKFGIHKNKKKLLSNFEILNCFVFNIKPLFKKELGDKK